VADFILPNLGDGVAQGDVLKVLVKAGDTIAVDQPVVELETDKATIEVPSDVPAGEGSRVRPATSEAKAVSVLEVPVGRVRR
jgi:pyruvate dehydrogenase E2 component (dihydrolipoamide acetyltransferase)